MGSHSNTLLAFIIITSFYVVVSSVVSFDENFMILYDNIIEFSTKILYVYIIEFSTKLTTDNTTRLVIIIKTNNYVSGIP